MGLVYSSFDLTGVIVEFTVGPEDEDSTVTSFKHKKSGDELNFGQVGRWLVDLEGEWECEFPKEHGKYRMEASWHDDREFVTEVIKVEKIG